MKVFEKSNAIEAELFEGAEFCDGQYTTPLDDSFAGSFNEWLEKGLGENSYCYQTQREEEGKFIRYLHIINPEGKYIMSAAPGDWVIRDASGSLSSCTPEVFEQKYHAITYKPNKLLRFRKKELSSGVSTSGEVFQH